MHQKGYTLVQVLSAYPIFSKCEMNITDMLIFITIVVYFHWVSCENPPSTKTLRQTPPDMTHSQYEIK